MSRATAMRRASVGLTLRALPEAVAVRLVRRALLLRGDAWGFGERGPRIACASAAFRRAYPDQEPSAWVDRWRQARFEATAVSLVVLARMASGRSPRMVVQPPRVGSGPAVVAFPHTVLDPLPQISLLAGDPDLTFLWPNFPLGEVGGGGDGEWDDDRALWTAVGSLPERLSKALVPITDPSWLVRCMGALRQGGAALLAMDVAFEASRRPSTSIVVGQASIPLSPAIEVAGQRTGARLLFLYPVRIGVRRWTVQLREMADVEDLAAAAGSWIEANPLAWAGWPFLACREPVARMRRAQRETSSGESA
jgi:hypothetical protein